MLFEHWIYSLAIAIIAGMVHFKRTGRDYSWIIIASAYAPDLDILAGYIFKQFDIAVLINGIPLKHGDFHNIPALVIFAGVAVLLLNMAGMKFRDSFMFAGIGFGAHIFEDVLVYNPGYAFLWPLSRHVFGIGIFEYWPAEWYGIANTVVLIGGLIAILLCLTIRIIFEDTYGLKRTIKAYAGAIIFSIIMMSVIGFYDFNLKEKVIAGNIVDNWQFTQDSSWDSTIFHNGSHSAKIEISGNESKISGVWKSNEYSVKPDTNYTFTAWGKIKDVGGNYSPAIRVIELNANGKSVRQTNIEFGKGAQDWVQKRTVFKTRSNTSWIYVHGNIWKGYGTFWLDDIELYEEGTDQNIIKNNGFEIGIKDIINIRV